MHDEVSGENGFDLKAPCSEPLLNLYRRKSRRQQAIAASTRIHIVGDLLSLRCECGYHSDELVSGGVMSGVIDLFACANCRGVVSSLTWSAGYPGSPPEGVVATVCPLCGGRNLDPWGEGDLPAGPCPRCGHRVQTRSIGIAD